MSAQLLLRQCLLTQRFDLREADGRTFLQVETPPPTGSVLTIVSEDAAPKHFLVEQVVEVAEDENGIGCFGAFVDEAPSSSIGVENLAPDPEAVQVVLARDPSLADQFGASPAGQAAAGSESSDAGEPESQGSDATAEGAGESAEGVDESVAASGESAPDDSAPAEVAASDETAASTVNGDVPAKNKKKKPKKRKGRKRN